ncbi:MAG: hypothetical protein LUH18_05555 [Oscillospiraceae bacterium]|nr:hypothetical protein [Oscillospiraceae bacterium]
MIRTRTEIKNFKIWMICLTLFLWALLIAAPFLGLLDDSLLYSIFPFLNFGLVIEGTIAGNELPQFVKDNFSFGLSLACVMLAIALIVMVVYFAVKCILASQRSKARKVLRKTGYSAEYFALLERKKNHFKGSYLEAVNDLCLAKEYGDGRRYDAALDILRNVDIDKFKINDASHYYSLYAYIFILTGNLENAGFAIDLGVPFSEKANDKSEMEFVSALLLYAQKDYEGAENAFMPLLKSRNNEVKVWAGMYLGLIYLRKHENENARKTVVALSKLKKTPRQSEDILKLLKKIETAYALEEEERQEELAAGEALPEE